jgi:hypothetical protein
MSATDNDELEQRVCRSCQQTYTYPVRRSLATRFYCEACMELPARVRAAFEKYNRRLKELASQVGQLQRELERQRQAK